MLGRPREGKTIACAHCGKPVYRPPSALSKTLCSYACRSAVIMLKRRNPEDGTVKCAKCKEWKPVAQFVKSTGGQPHSYCKPCSSVWFHERRGTPEEIRKPYRPAYRLTDEEKRRNKREANQRAHQARRAAGAAPHKFDIGRIYCMQDAECIYCKTPLTRYHIDHKHPVSRGGTNDLTNLHLTCPACNMAKGAMTHEEFLVSKRRRLPRNIRPAA